MRKFLLRLKQKFCRSIWLTNPVFMGMKQSLYPEKIAKFRFDKRCMDCNLKTTEYKEITLW